jgi:hypothetical protein
VTNSNHPLARPHTTCYRFNFFAWRVIPRDLLSSSSLRGIFHIHPSSTFLFVVKLNLSQRAAAPARTADRTGSVFFHSIHFSFADIYRLMLSDKRYGLSVNLMATKVMPSLLPQTVNPSLNLEQFTILLEVLQEMLDQIDRNQRNKLKLDNLSLPSPERHRPLRHQYSSDNMHVPPFNIPNLRIEQRKTSSAEDMARKNSTGKHICLVYNLRKISCCLSYVQMCKNARFVHQVACWGAGGSEGRLRRPTATSSGW